MAEVFPNFEESEMRNRTDALHEDALALARVFVYSLDKKHLDFFKVYGWDPEDLTTELLLKIGDPNKGFNPSKGSYQNFFYLKLRQSLTELSRAVGAKKRGGSAEHSSLLYEEMEKLQHHNPNALNEHESKILLEQLLSKLDVIEKRFFELYYLEGLTISDIASDMQVSVATANRLQARFRHKINLLDKSK